MKAFLFVFAVILLQFELCAQSPAFEQQDVLLADGQEVLLWISLDESSEMLHYKKEESAKPSTYSASDVVSFRYQDHLYYTLPLRDGYYTFFKVFHEGKEFAVLEKAPSFKALRVVIEESEERLSMCQNRRNKEFYLCRKDNSRDNLLPAALEVPIPGAREALTIRQFEVKKLVYLAVEGKLKLFYMETDERFSLWDDILEAKPGQRKAEQMFERFIEDEQKISLIQKKVKQDKLDIRNPQHLILALGAAYQ